MELILSSKHAGHLCVIPESNALGLEQLPLILPEFRFAIDLVESFDIRALRPTRPGESPPDRRPLGQRCHPWSDRCYAASVCRSRRLPYGCAETARRCARRASLRGSLHSERKVSEGNSTPAHRTSTASIFFRHRLLAAGRQVGAANCT